MSGHGRTVPGGGRRPGRCAVDAGRRGRYGRRDPHRGIRSVYLLDDAPDGFAHVLYTDGFAREAPSLGVEVAGRSRIDVDVPSFAPLADRVARSGADGVVVGDALGFGGARLLEALRARLGSEITLLTGDGYAPVRSVRREAGRAAENLRA